MGVGQHRHIFPLLFVAADNAAYFFQKRHKDIGYALFERERNAGVVYVLRSEAKVDEFAVAGVYAQSGKLLFDKVFHRLHVVVCGALNLLYSRRILF